ncbi:RimJ/RimL family protein N-acetyltransferase [Kitasatospora sp. SolWspMP-SS2h]|nr:RimJ/RimL family protein N-acetyltransferase [Kitasatospora sp. SolWspMP-SS2h]
MTTRRGTAAYAAGMPDPARWPVATEITAGALRLEPLRAAHAAEAFTLLDDVRLHTWTGGHPLPPEQLHARYRRLERGCSPDGEQGWLNWMLRRDSDRQLVGTVQATLARTPDGRVTAELAWVIGTAHQGHGHARTGARAMAHWLRTRRVDVLLAHIHPEHPASAGVARALGLTPTDTTVDGEIRWTSEPPPPAPRT